MPAEVESMFSAREIPWHRIGTIVDGVLTAEEALETGGLDWEVELRPLKVYMGDRPDSSRYVSVDDRLGLVRNTDHAVLGVVGTNYVPFQNHQAFEFFDNLVDSGEAKYETAGSLRGGKWVWLTAKVPQHISIGGVDEHEVYLLLSTSHDGSRAITVSVTPVRVVCTNTLNFALRQAKRKWSVRHISTADQRLQEAREAIGMTFRYLDTFQAEAEELLAQAFTEKEFTKLVEQLIPDRPRKEKVVDILRQDFVEGPTLENVRGTKWAALNAVGEYFDWLREPRTAEAQVMGIWDGVAMKMKDRTLKLLNA